MQSFSKFETQLGKNVVYHRVTNHGNSKTIGNCLCYKKKFWWITRPQSSAGVCGVYAGTSKLSGIFACSKLPSTSSFFDVYIFVFFDCVHIYPIICYNQDDEHADDVALVRECIERGHEDRYGHLINHLCRARDNSGCVT